MKKIQSFEEHASKDTSDKSKVESYPPPKYVVKLAKGDKGFALLKGMLSNLKQIIKPGIWSTQ